MASRSAKPIPVRRVAAAMGVDLGALVPKERIALRDLGGQTVAIDGHNTLYQFLSIIRQPDGTPLQDAQGRVTSHLSGLLYRTSNLVEAGIKPVFVFDGKPHERKRGVLRARRERKEAAKQQMQEAQAAGDEAKAFTKAQQTASLTWDMVRQGMALLDALGLPYLEAPGEGEAQAAHMAARGTVDAAVSQDFDALLFGAPVLVRNLALTGRRKLPGRQAWIDVEPERIRLEEALRSLALTREQLVALAILMGTDYNEGIKGVGPKKALKLVKEQGTLAAALAKAGAPDEGLEEVEALFLRPAVRDDVVPAWRAPDAGRVLDIMVGEHAFNEERVKGALAKFGGLAEARKQRSLDAFF
jgi:flap endonuclease-1